MQHEKQVGGKVPIERLKGSHTRLTLAVLIEDRRQIVWILTVQYKIQVGGVFKVPKKEKKREVGGQSVRGCKGWEATVPITLICNL